MKPTPKLRFVERNEKVTLNGEEFDNWRFILQQWWEQGRSMNLGWGDIPLGEAKGEWRDVPLEVEN